MKERSHLDKKRLFIIGGLIFILIIPSKACGEGFKEGREGVLNLVDTPTSYIYPKGEYGVNLRVYDDGSLLFRFALALTNYLMLGVPLDIRHFIGKKEIEIELPPVIWAKLRLTRPKIPLPLTIGYDPIDYGERTRGVYLVTTIPTYPLRLPIEWHLGMNLDLEDPGRRGICGFVGLDLSINPYLLFYTELDGLNLKGKRTFLNLGLRYLASEHLELDLNLQDIQSANPDRFICFEYSNRLF